MPRVFAVPHKIITGAGAFEQTGQEVQGLGKHTALIVTDPTMKAQGYVDQLQQSLNDAGIASLVYGDITQEPIDTYVEEGRQLLGQHHLEIILALGGGSVIDTAKAIALMAQNPGQIKDYMGAGKAKQPGVPILAIPTTAGTGSEVTPYTIITDTTSNVKMLIATPFILPTIAINDPQLTISMPPSLTAATGLDAMAHALEAYISIQTQTLTEPYSLRAIELISANIRKAYADGKDLQARSRMLDGALLAGIAFANSSVALIHGMARPLGAYFHVPHGLAIASLMVVVTDFSLMGNPERYAAIARILGAKTDGLSHMSTARTLTRTLSRLLEDLHMPKLRELGINRDAFDRVVARMAQDALASGSPKNNPRIATESEIVQLYQAAY